MKYKYSIVIPCFNEENSVFKVVNTICIKFPNILVVVIDDGSTDNSYLELQKIKSKNLNLFKNENNYGKGYSIRKGLENIKNKSDIVIFTDADEEINIDDISKLISLYEKFDYDSVFGSRFLKMNFSEKVNMGFHRYLANILLTKLSNLRLNQNLTDMETALKSFKTKYVNKLNLQSDRFEIEPEIVKGLSNLNIKIMEVPVSYNPRSIKEGKKISFKDGIKALIYLINLK